MPRQNSLNSAESERNGAGHTLDASENAGEPHAALRKFQPHLEAR